MSTFVDTSAILAVLDADERNHTRAAKAWRSLIEAEEPMVTTSYIVVETFALVQHRLGIAAIRVLQDDVLPLIRIRWIDEEIHRRAAAAILAAARRRLTLVDCVSFEVMRDEGIRIAFTLDRDFADQGFDRIR